jgi:DNA-directed RNA polymerase II subunit RPB2
MTTPTRKDLEQLGLSYFKEHGLVDFQTRSYDYFTDVVIPEIINGASITVKTDKKKVQVRFINIYYDQPIIQTKNGTILMTPNDARLCNMSYDLTLSADIEEIIMKGDEVISTTLIKKRKIGEIPLMLRSSRCVLSGSTTDECVEMGECHHDPGGYFILKGNERVIISHERLKGNQVYVFKEKNSSKKKWRYSAEVRSFSKSSWSLFNQIVLIDGSIGVILPSFNIPIPVGILMRLCGAATDDDIRTVIGYPKGNVYIESIIREASNIRKKNQAIEAIGRLLPKSIAEKDRKKTIKNLFFTEFLPHLGPLVKKKLIFIGHAVKKLLSRVCGDRKDDDDRDHFTNKRADTSGFMLSTLFRGVFKRFLKVLGDTLEKKVSLEDSLREIRFPITKDIKYSMSTGNWSAYKSTKARQGVSQILSRLTYVSMLSHLRRLVTPTGNEGKVSKLRQLHMSQWGILCPFETPEGKQCGIVKNFSLSTIVSTEVSIVTVLQLMESCDSFDSIENEIIQIHNISNRCEVFVNDDLVGYVDNGLEFTKKMKLSRRDGIIDWQVSISFNNIENEAKFYTDNGRCMRPVLRVINGEVAIKKEDITGKKWSEIVNEGFIEYIDSSETEWNKIALYPENTNDTFDYCEIDPFLILGVCASIIPFPGHNPAPRNSFEASMIKQAIGVYATNFNLRYDTTAHVLNYSQKPLCSTVSTQIGGIGDLSPGYNAIVAVCVYGGHNQEDSLIMNQSAIDMGMFHSLFLKSYECGEELGGDYSRRKIGIPDEAVRNKSLCYNKLGKDGIVIKGSLVDDGDVLISRVSTSPSGKSDSSEFVRKGTGSGKVDRIFIGFNSEGVKVVKVRVCCVRIPEVGDKFASRQAQKGTLGKTYSREDMPWSIRNGISPDIIINPAAFPSRMTVALPIETCAGKSACISGEFADATPFREIDHEKIGNDMKSAGLQSLGYEMMCNGFTGKPFRAMIFMGPVFYQKLKHMVIDKIHSRSRGPVQMMYRQPVEGRSRGGGLRLGEMEREAVIAYGGSAMLHDRLFVNSDPFSVEKCLKCGLIINSSDGTCYPCNQKAVKVQIPYACKILFQELGAVGIKIAMH